MRDEEKEREKERWRDRKREREKEEKCSGNLTLQHKVSFFTRSLLPPSSSLHPPFSVPSLVLSRPRCCWAAYQADLHTECWKGSGERQAGETGQSATREQGVHFTSLHFTSLCSPAVDSVDLLPKLPGQTKKKEKESSTQVSVAFAVTATVHPCKPGELLNWFFLFNRRPSG